MARAKYRGIYSLLWRLPKILLYRLKFKNRTKKQYTVSWVIVCYTLRSFLENVNNKNYKQKNVKGKWKRTSIVPVTVYARSFLWNIGTVAAWNASTIRFHLVFLCGIFTACKWTDHTATINTLYHTRTWSLQCDATILVALVTFFYRIRIWE